MMSDGSKANTTILLMVMCKKINSFDKPTDFLQERIQRKEICSVSVLEYKLLKPYNLV